MFEKPEYLQDPVAAADFRSDFDELLSGQITDDKFVEFQKHAESKADDLILAASAFTIMRAQTEKQSYKHPVPKGKRTMLRQAELLANNIEAAEVLFRDPDQAHELILFTKDRTHSITERGKWVEVHLALTIGGWLKHRAWRGRENNEPAEYWLEPMIRHGVPSPRIVWGEADSWLQGSPQYFKYFAEHPDEDPIESRDYRSHFGQMFKMDYADMHELSFWPLVTKLPPIVVGREAIMELYAKALDLNNEPGQYSSQRQRQPGWLLFRQLHYLGDPMAAEAYNLADQKGLLPVWQNQMLDEVALGISSGVKTVHEQGQDLELVKQKNEAWKFFFGGFDLHSEEFNWLKVDKQELVTRTEHHVKRLGIAATQREIAIGVNQALRY